MGEKSGGVKGVSLRAQAGRSQPCFLGSMRGNGLMVTEAIRKIVQADRCRCRRGAQLLRSCHLCRWWGLRPVNVLSPLPPQPLSATIETVTYPPSLFSLPFPFPSLSSLCLHSRAMASTDKSEGKNNKSGRSKSEGKSRL